MRQKSVSSAYAAAELLARDFRANHDFSNAAKSASEAASIALNDGDFESWRSMIYFRAENCLSDANFEGCADTASQLAKDPQLNSPQFRARVHILMAKAHQGSGLLESAAVEAQAAVELTNDESDLDLNVEARQALIAALADSGKLVEAWSESQKLASVVSEELDDQLAGKAFWVIGNVAFLCDKVDEGLQYHELAAATFSPTKNLNVWAKFNKASAAMRLAANVADADTLRCIERAELATDVIGGTVNDYVLLKLNRAHWNILASEPQAAIEILEDVCRRDDLVTPQRSGETRLLLGRALAAAGEKAEARDSFFKAAVHFDAAGAPDRAKQARDFLQAEPGTASFSSRIRRRMGFGRR